jgi:outer membrane protein assembly factor BamB
VNRVCRNGMIGRLSSLLGVVLVLAACTGTPQKFKPAELGPNPGLLGVRLAWAAQIGPVDFPLDIKVNGEQITLAGGDGTVAVLDARKGTELWRAKSAGLIGAGVGSDGRLTAVLTRSNELVVIEAGRELWRQKVPAQGFTAPLVAGGRVFLLTADRGVSAFDAVSGRKLWSQQRPGEALVLRQAGVLLAVGDTLVVGLGGRLIGMNPGNGGIRWEAPLASPRGTNDVERLVDLVGPVSREGDVVCVRAFQAAVGCVSAARGNVLWTRPASGAVGVHGDARSVFGVEGDGRILAWRRSDGQPVWTSERLRYRELSAPLAVGRSVAVGDDSGLVHWLSREDGALLTRMATDGSAVVGAPVLAGGTVVVVTRKGGVFGFQPD